EHDTRATTRHDRNERTPKPTGTASAHPCLLTNPHTYQGVSSQSRFDVLDNGSVDVSSVTVGMAVSDLAPSILWYQGAFELSVPDATPADGVVEFRVGPAWLQLGAESSARSGAEVVVRLGVADASRERERLAALGISVGPVERIENAVD
ncbi:MAG: VOC family protein, partial [Desertimonas sp.]